ncbi:MAG: hypothetical protein PHO89_09570, partial [Methylacidiphilaceae bacterium]|nr:hypothetical protein [Candidatus Methylacidiphilaceae bacterium]
MEPAIGESTEARGRSLYWFAAGALFFLAALRLLDSRISKEPLQAAPLQPERWLSLAQERAGEGKIDEAKAMLAECRRQAGPLSTLRLKAATLAIELGEWGPAFRDLRFVFRADPELRGPAAYVAKSTWGEKGGLRLVPAANPRLLAAYFDLALQEGWLTEASQLWERAEREKRPFEPARARRYIGALWEADQLAEARKVWSSLYGGEGIVWNGGFERDLVGWGFGWKTRPQSGVGIRRDEKSASAGKTSLRVRLGGLSVETDHVFAEQTILLTPGGRYELRAKGRAEEITGSSGL